LGDDEIVDEFWLHYERNAIHVQNHGNHNFSCWKNGAEICRFKLPVHAWNQISGIIQLVLTLNRITSKYQMCIRSVVEPNIRTVTTDVLWKQDKRCLIVTQTRRSSDNSLLRDPTNAAETGLDINVEFNPNLDIGRENGLISPCSAAILVICGGGGYCHNNLQFVNRGGMGENSYIAKYVTKGVGQLINSMSLLNEAMAANRTSVHPDNEENPLRPALFVTQRAINSSSKMSEFSLTLMLASLIGLPQFISSSEFARVAVTSAKKHLLLTTPVVQEEADVVNGQNELDEDGPDALDLEIQMADAAYDISAAGTILIGAIPPRISNDPTAMPRPTEVVAIFQHTDYLFRGDEFEELNLLEFASIVRKVLLEESNERSETSVRGRRANMKVKFVPVSGNTHPQAASHQLSLV